MPQVIGKLARYPARVAFGWYLTIALVGAGILSTPVCSANSRAPISVLEAAFTATSALCVTGLAVRSTGHDFTFVGQCIILILIQLGGIGIMTVTTYLVFALGSRESPRSRAVLTETLGAEEGTELSWVLAHVLLTTAVVEGLGFALLLIRFSMLYPLGKATWFALFHSVSAFCNAGFSLNDDSLVPYRDDLLVNFTIGGLIMVGGIGFPVIWDLARNIRSLGWDTWGQLRLHTKLMLVSSLAMWLVAMLFMLVLEWNASLADLSWGGKFLAAAFQSVTLRTAGFNTVDFARFTNAMLFVSILFMMIGAGPGSTGGGIKVSTFMVLLLQAWGTFTGHEEVQIFRRRIPAATVQRAMATSSLFIAVGGAALTLLMVVEQSSPHEVLKGAFLEAMFEVVSALGTVGLSVGLTASLSTVGKLIIIVLMFMGRLGPITAFAALARVGRSKIGTMAEEDTLIG